MESSIVSLVATPSQQLLVVIPVHFVAVERQVNQLPEVHLLLDKFPLFLVPPGLKLYALVLSCSSSLELKLFLLPRPDRPRIV